MAAKLEETVVDAYPFGAKQAGQISASTLLGRSMRGGYRSCRSRAAGE